MKKLILILGLFSALCAISLLGLTTYLAYDAISGHFYIMEWVFPSNCGKKVEAANKVANKIWADTISLSSYKAKQLCAFSKLVRELKESPDFFKRIKVNLSHGCDPIGMNKPPVTADQLLKWASFDFIYLEFPNGFWDEQPGILSIHCDNYDKENPEFFAKITTTEKGCTYERSLSIPYYMARTGEESISEIEEQAYVLEAIEYAIYAIAK